jgi:cytochrome b pre-mRNA-processing protein 3
LQPKGPFGWHLRLATWSPFVAMFAWLSRRLDRHRNARELYGSIVTQARAPIFYAAWGVPDTVQGRFEMLVLHVCVVLDRLQQEAAPGGELARAVTEAFIADMDASMREMTFGDLAVPREIARTAAALFDRHSAYQRLLKARQEAPLSQSLATQMAYLGAGTRLDTARLAHYILEAADRLGRQPGSELLAGRLGWPVP